MVAHTQTGIFYVWVLGNSVQYMDGTTRKARYMNGCPFMYGAEPYMNGHFPCSGTDICLLLDPRKNTYLTNPRYVVRYSIYLTYVIYSTYHTYRISKQAPLDIYHYGTTTATTVTIDHEQNVVVIDIVRHGRRLFLGPATRTPQLDPSLYSRICISWGRKARSGMARQ